jgi:hypothetical protein
MLDGEDHLNMSFRIVYAIADSVVAAPGAMHSGEPEFEWLSDPVRVGRQRAVENSTAAVAAFSGILVSALRAGAVHQTAKGSGFMLRG